MDTLHIVPVGDIPLRHLDELAAALARALRISCHVESRALDANPAWDARRNQYWSSALLRELLQRYPGEHRILGVTELDLYVPVLTFVFGEAQMGGRAAIVSACRLDDAFYGLPPAPAVLGERLLKEALHELGHTFGLLHCPDWRCVMTSSHAVEKLDVKNAAFCPDCLDKVLSTNGKSL